MGLETVRELVQVDGLVLERTPQALDEDVVHAPAPAVHRDGDPGVVEYGGELHAGELAALVGVEDIGAAVALQGLCVALQLFAHYHAMERACEIDLPRNLEKSVTVE